MAVMSSKGPSSQLVPMPGKPRVQWSLVPNESPAPILADRIVQYFENVPGCLMVVAFVPQNSDAGEAGSQEVAVVPLPQGHASLPKQPAPFGVAGNGLKRPN